MVEEGHNRLTFTDSKLELKICFSFLYFTSSRSVNFMKHISTLFN
jgi:hypothetical protein